MPRPSTSSKCSSSRAEAPATLASSQKRELCSGVHPCPRGCSCGGGWGPSSGANLLWACGRARVGGGWRSCCDPTGCARSSATSFSSFAFSFVLIFSPFRCCYACRTLSTVLSSRAPAGLVPGGGAPDVAPGGDDGRLGGHIDPSGLQLSSSRSDQFKPDDASRAPNTHHCTVLDLASAATVCTWVHKVGQVGVYRTVDTGRVFFFFLRCGFRSSCLCAGPSGARRAFASLEVAVGMCMRLPRACTKRR